VVFAKSHLLSAKCDILFVVTLSLNNFGFRGKRPHHYNLRQFLSLQVYKVNFCKSENGFYRCSHEWLRNVPKIDKCHCFECHSSQRGHNSVCQHLRTFSTWLTRTGNSNISLSSALNRTVSVKNYFIVFAHYKSDGTTDSVRQLVTHQTDHDESKPEVVLFSGRRCCRPLLTDIMCV